MKSHEWSAIREQFDQYGVEGQCKFKICLDLTLYFDGRFRENADGILHFYQQCLKLIEKDIKFFDVDGKNKFKKIKSDTLDLLPYWTTAEAEARDIYGLKLESGQTKEDVSDRAFHMYRGRLNPGYVRLIVPLEYASDSAQSFVLVAKNAADRLRFISGHGGYSTNMTSDYESQQESGHVYALSRRYQGVDFDIPRSFARFMKDGIKGINWLTFLGESLVAKLGGKEELKAKLSKELSFHELQHGIMVQAGPEPQLGDVNRKERLAKYHEVGKVLRSLRIPDEVLRNYNGIGGTENTKEWLNRFFQ
ncbi:MAG: type VI immunity family protein [bacterium]